MEGEGGGGEYQYKDSWVDGAGRASDYLGALEEAEVGEGVGEGEEVPAAPREGQDLPRRVGRGLGAPRLAAVVVCKGGGRMLLFVVCKGGGRIVCRSTTEGDSMH